jgi:hypothetical protein
MYKLAYFVNFTHILLQELVFRFPTSVSCNSLSQLLAYHFSISYWFLACHARVLQLIFYIQLIRKIHQYLIYNSPFCCNSFSLSYYHWQNGDPPSVFPSEMWILTFILARSAEARLVKDQTHKLEQQHRGEWRKEIHHWCTYNTTVARTSPLLTLCNVHVVQLAVYHTSIPRNHKTQS